MDFDKKDKITVVNEKSTPESRGRRLRRVRNMANLDRAELCSDGTLNINTYKGWENGRYGGLTADGAERFVKRVAKEGVVCTSDWLLNEEGISPYILPQSEDEKLTSKGSNEEQLILNELALFKKQFQNATDCKISDNGLHPYYNEGDYVAGIRKFGAEIANFIGENCIVETENNELLVRNLREGESRETYTLVCLNPKSTVKVPNIYNTKLISAAPIIRHYRFKQ